MLLDEPFSNMDAASVRQMMTLLGRLREAGRTILLTTHQRDLAAPLADYFLTMEAGRLDFDDARSGSCIGPKRLQARDKSAGDKSGGDTSRMKKTNAARILDGLGIAYSLQEYEVDPDDLTAVTVARKIGMPPGAGLQNASNQDRLTDRPRRVRLCGHSRRRRTGFQEARTSCGSAQGDDGEPEGCAAAHRLHPRRRDRIRARQELPAYVDETIERFDLISVSAGQRGTQILLSPADYLRATGATLADLSKEAARP